MSGGTHTVGLLHPGAMGVTIGASALASPSVDAVLWCSAGRSDETRQRAESTGLTEVETLDALVAGSDVILSVCPPGSAADVAAAVADLGFGGTYVDANAIAPASTNAIGAHLRRFVDGGIVGPPANRPGRTRLFLSGPHASDVAALFMHGSVQPVVLDGPVGAASALKIAYAAWTKVSAALLLGVNAYAESRGVADALRAEWERSQPDLPARSEQTAAGAAPKAWRWAAEMDEIATAFAAVGLPSGLGDAAAQIYRRLDSLRDADDVDLATVIELLRGRAGDAPQTEPS